MLRRLTADATLSEFDVVILDEVHERHLNTDLLLGLLRELLSRRSDLRLVLMSATINQQLYADYFHRAPVIQVCLCHPSRGRSGWG